jgi:asparagine synthase (glutamine-hydrolysing)
VPLGAFLSGGIDSSLVVAMMQTQATRPSRTFCIGFREAKFDESAFAGQVARHLGSEHTELFVEPGMALGVVPRLAEIYDEPFADSSQIPTLVLSELTRRHVTVALSGDGGDELFGGYSRYRQMNGLQHLLPLPGRLRHGVARALRGVPMQPFRAHPGARTAIDRARRVAGLLEERSPTSMYEAHLRYWSAEEHLVDGATVPEAALPSDDLPTYGEWMQLRDTLDYLPGDILCKVDRASMAASLEVRVPFLDPRVLEFAWSLPAALKFDGWQGKRVLRALIHRYVPATLVDRPKMGFGIPAADWLRGPLRPWAEALLSPERLLRDGLLQVGPIRKAWREHLSGQYDHHTRLWAVLMLNAWIDRWSRGQRPAASKAS